MVAIKMLKKLFSLAGLLKKEFGITISSSGEDPNEIKQPKDIVSSYLYLMGKDSEQINGQMIDA